MKSLQFCKNAFGHLRNILVHKYWVYYFGRKLGIGRWRLIKHDISKFSFTEFIESVKYYQGTSSPILFVRKLTDIQKLGNIIKVGTNIITNIGRIIMIPA